MDYATLDCPFEIKADSISEEGIFEGYGSVFDQPIRHLFFGTDVVKPGAFMDSITRKGAKGIKMLWQHDMTEPIGRWLDIAEDQKGLYVKGQLLLELPTAKKAHILMREKVIEGLSIGFNAHAKENEFDPNKQTRTLRKIDLFEVSPVTFPAQPIAKIRSVKSALTTIRQFEEFLREVGFSIREAKALASAGWPALQRDVDSEPSPQPVLTTGLLTALRDARSQLHGPLFGGFRNARAGGSATQV